jgi:hypothetical protein
MLMVEFETPKGRRIFYNPVHIVSISTNKKDPSPTDICTANPKYDGTVKGNVKEVARKLSRN